MLQKNPIKGIILDVDGVIVGSTKGYNWPFPHKDIINALHTIHQRGLFISLCTGKGTFAIKDIVLAAQLDNLHIGDGGAVVMDFIQDKIIKAHTIDTEDAINIITILQKNNVYTELYDIHGYYIQQNEISEITEKHIAILNKEPVKVNSLVDFAHTNQLVKIMPIAKNEDDKQRIAATILEIKIDLTLQWGVHPTALPHQFGIITSKGISKKQAAETISRTTNVPFENILGVGDSLMDWEFIKLCKYAGIMGNASNELKEIAKTKNNENVTTGGSVEINGLLDIFTYFNLL